MARKRKIPARKHHGIRDPLKQLAIQSEKLKGITNNPPIKGDDQKVSKNFAQFMKLANAAKSGKKIKRIRSGIEDLPKVTRKDKTTTTSSNKIRTIKQLPNEDDADYLRRVNRMTTESLKEAEYEAKYGVSVVRDNKTGAIVIKKKPPNEIDELLKKKKSKQPISKKAANKIDPKLAKELVKQAIKESKEELKSEEKAAEEYKRDVFKFGEVVHAPPTLSVLPRKAAKSETVPRPGKKDNLLLKTMLQTPEDKKKATPSATPQTKKNMKLFKGKLKGKRKDLPPVTRVMIEEEQSKIINLYRQLKKNKNPQSES